MAGEQDVQKTKRDTSRTKTVWIPAETHQRVTEWCEARGIKFRFLVTQLIEEGLKRLAEAEKRSRRGQK